MQKWEQIQGVYIHTPFCLQKCLYCDFASYAGADTETMEKYVDAVCSEIMMRSNEVTIADQATLYFGGGTPSLLSEKLLAKLCLACVCQSKEKDHHSNVNNKRICKDGPVFLSTEVEI